MTCDLIGLSKGLVIRSRLIACPMRLSSKQLWVYEGPATILESLLALHQLAFRDLAISGHQVPHSSYPAWIMALIDMPDGE